MSCPNIALSLKMPPTGVSSEMAQLRQSYRLGSAMVTQSSLLLELSRRRCISFLKGVFGTFCGSESHWVSSPYCLNLGENRF